MMTVNSVLICVFDYVDDAVNQLSNGVFLSKLKHRQLLAAAGYLADMD